MTVNELKGYLQTNWEVIKRRLLESSYYPAAVKLVEIPKTARGHATARVYPRFWTARFNKHLIKY